MAQATSNDLLSSILFQVQIANAHMEKLEKNNSDKITKEATSGLKTPLSKMGNLSGETANSIKTLSSIGLKDIVRVSVMPLEKIALKLNSFTSILASIPKEQTENAIKNASMFSSVIETVNNMNIRKLYTNLLLFPEKSLNSFIVSIGNFVNKLNEAFNGKLNKTEQGNLKEKISTIGNVTEDLMKITFKIKFFPEKTLNKFVSSIGGFIDKLNEAFNGKFGKKDREDINEKTNALGGIIDTITKTMGKVTVVGLLTPVLLPLGILGFATISVYLKGFSILSKIINSVGSENVLKETSESTKNIALMALLASGVVLASVAIGAIITKPGVISMALAGFAAIVVSMIALQGVLTIINIVGSDKQKTQSAGSVKNILTLMGGALLIPLAAIGIGALLSKPGVRAMAEIGMLAIGVSLLGFWAISKLIEKVAKATNNSLSAAGSIIMLAGTSILLVIASMGIGALVDKAGGKKRLLLGMGAAGAVIVEFGVLATAIGLVSKIIASKSAIIGMVAIIGLAAISILLTKKVMQLSDYFGADISAGWKRFGSTLGAMAALVGSFAVLATAIGGLLMIPMMPLIMGAGVGMIMGLSLAISAVAGAIKKTMEASNLLKGEDGAKAPINNMISFMDGTKSLMIKIGDMGKSLKFFSIMKTIIAINGIVGAMGGYAKILQTTGGKPGFVKGINGYDSKGNPIYGEDVNIALTSANLSSGFSTFVSTVMTTLNSIDWGKFKTTTLLKISWLMNPISKFAKIIQEVGAEAGKIRSIKKYDENGNPVYGENIEIVPVATNISSGFAIFAQNIMDGLSNVKTKMGDFRKAKVMGAIMEPVSQFAKIIQEFGAGKNDDELVSLTFDENGNVTGKETINVKTIVTRIANAFDTFMTQMQTTMDKFKTPVISLNKVDVSDIIEPVIDVIEQMRDKLQGSDVDNFTKNIDTIGQSFTKMQNLYVNSEAKALNKMFPDLTKNHVEFINKMNTAMKNVSSPLEKYVKQVERLVNAYDKLSQKYDANGNLVLTLEENTNTNNTVNVDKNALENLADDISSKITDGTKEAINNISITMQNPVKNPNMQNISLEVSTN